MMRGVGYVMRGGRYVMRGGRYVMRGAGYMMRASDMTYGSMTARDMMNAGGSASPASMRSAWVSATSMMLGGWNIEER
jgi:hypothetical protein